MKHKKVSATESKILTSIIDKGRQYFTLPEAYQWFPDMSGNQIRVLLKRMTDGGLLMRVREGVYYIIPFEYDSEMFMPDWHLLAAPLVGNVEYYIGYFSALQIHSLTTQPYLGEQIVVNKQMRPSELRIKNIPFQFIYHNEAHFFGYKKTWIDSYHRVLCSDLEKTIIDCLFKPQYAASITEVAKAIYASKDDMDFQKLLQYAKQFNSQAVIKRLGFLLELLSISSPIIEELQQLRTNSFVLLDPCYPQTGKTISRWGIQQNLESQSIISPIYT